MSASVILLKNCAFRDLSQKRTMAQNVLLMRNGFILVGYSYGWQKIFGFFLRDCRSQAHGLICFITVCLPTKVYLFFVWSFLRRLGFFVTMWGQHQGNDNFSLYSRFLISLGYQAEFGLNYYTQWIFHKTTLHTLPRIGDSIHLIISNQ